MDAAREPDGSSVKAITVTLTQRQIEIIELLVDRAASEALLWGQRPDDVLHALADIATAVGATRRSDAS